MSETNNNNDIFDADFASGVAAYDAKNFSMAYQLLAPLANNNNPEALWRIAMMQAYGLGMIQNQELGVENFQKAHELGSGMASHMLGVAYMNGEGVEKNLDQAIDYFEQAVERGMQGAAFSLSMIYSDMLNDATKAEEWINIANKMENY
jgi:TPR repeat protein